jgi:hypothetical protein
VQGSVLMPSATRYCIMCNIEISRINQNGDLLGEYNYKRRVTCSTDCAVERRRSKLVQKNRQIEAIDHFNLGRIHLLKG